MTSIKIQAGFFVRTATLDIARELLGKRLVTRIDGLLTSAILTETEAYLGEQDRASHAWNGRKTARTEVMYQTGGIAYVYFCYGMHHMMNVVTGPEGSAHAVLLRAGIPDQGLPHQLHRRGKTKPDKTLLGGPGSLCKALGITRDQNREPLSGDLIWLEDTGLILQDQAILTGPRIGVDYAGGDALLPYRFRLHPDVVTRLFPSGKTTG